MGLEKIHIWAINRFIYEPVVNVVAPKLLVCVRERTRLPKYVWKHFISHLSAAVETAIKNKTMAHAHGENIQNQKHLQETKQILYNITNKLPIKFTFTTCHHHYHHHVVPPAQISLPLSRHFSRSFIASGWSSGLHPVFSHSCCMYVRAGRPAFA